jgi:hypothetical protein
LQSLEFAFQIFTTIISSLSSTPHSTQRNYVSDISKSGEAKVGLRSAIGILRTPSLLLIHDVIRAVPKAEQKNPIRMVSCWLCSKQ